MTEVKNASFTRFKKKIGIIFLLLLTSILLLALWPLFLWYQINDGMSLPEVKEVLGPPFLNVDKKTLCDPFILNSRRCKKLIDAGSVDVVYWKKGIDTWIVVGFDQSEVVCSKLLFDH